MDSEQDRFFQALEGEVDPKTQRLEEGLDKVWTIAKELRLDPFPTHFEVIPPAIMYEIASYGLPGLFSHWTHGRAYRELKTLYDYGLSKIYELVINGNPSQAYLLENNSAAENITVMAHVLGHTDFFKNNYQFKPTRKDMTHVAPLTTERIERYEFDNGRLVVEQFLDSVLAVSEHVEPNHLLEPRLPRGEQEERWRQEYKDSLSKRPQKTEYDDIFSMGEKHLVEQAKGVMPIPYHPDKDLLGFIRDYAANLEDWQRDIVDIVREQSLYFWPQRRTKVMNEGWASFWHKRIMREMADRDFISKEEHEIWWKMHSGVVAPRKLGLNPYHFGMTMFEWIEDYHNGRIDETEKRWLVENDCPVYPKYDGNFKDSPGLARVLEVRRDEDDQSFIRNNFNKITADRLGMYIYDKDEDEHEVRYYVADKKWQNIRDGLVGSLTNCGIPYLVVTDGNYQRGGLYLKHQFEGQELDTNYVEKTLPYIHSLWKNPVYLESMRDSKQVLFSYESEKVEVKTV